MTAELERAWAAVRRTPADGMALVGGTDDPWACWARGVLLLARGDFVRSFGLLRGPARRTDELGALSCARIASGLRQIDDHHQAIAWDARAARTPVADGVIGLAADHVGTQDPAGAARLLVGVRPAGTRDVIRRSWVACEIALARGRTRAAVVHAERALRVSRSWGPRHELKSTLFLAAAVQDHDPERSRRMLRPALAAATRAQLWPLVWPMVAVLGEDADVAETAAAARAVGHIAARLPAQAGERWLARPDIARWLALGGASTGTQRTSRASAS